MRRIGLVAVVMSAMLSPAASAKNACRSQECRERVARKACSQKRPRACVERAIITYRLTGWKASWMRRVPACESGWNPYAVNGAPHNRRPVALHEGKSTGLFQFMPSTWRSTRYGERWIWSAKWQALAAAWMLEQGRAGEWVCS